MIKIKTVLNEERTLDFTLARYWQLLNDRAEGSITYMRCVDDEEVWVNMDHIVEVRELHDSP